MMVILSSTPDKTAYAIAEKAIRKWVTERLRRQPRAHGGMLYSFTLSGSTCNNMGVPLEVVMTVAVGADGRIEAATSRPAAADLGCQAMCAAHGDGRQFLADVGGCEEAIGLTLEQAAFRKWEEEPSGCFCTPGNRRHKWRNVFQTLHHAAAHER